MVNQFIESLSKLQQYYYGEDAASKLLESDGFAKMIDKTIISGKFKVPLARLTKSIDEFVSGKNVKGHEYFFTNSITFNESQNKLYIMRPFDSKQLSISFSKPDEISLIVMDTILKYGKRVSVDYKYFFTNEGISYQKSLYVPLSKKQQKLNTLARFDATGATEFYDHALGGLFYGKHIKGELIATLKSDPLAHIENELGEVKYCAESKRLEAFVNQGEVLVGYIAYDNGYEVRYHTKYSTVTDLNDLHLELDEVQTNQRFAELMKHRLFYSVKNAPAETEPPADKETTDEIQEVITDESHKEIKEESVTEEHNDQETEVIAEDKIN